MIQPEPARLDRAAAAIRRRVLDEVAITGAGAAASAVAAAEVVAVLYLDELRRGEGSEADAGPGTAEADRFVLAAPSAEATVAAARALAGEQDRPGAAGPAGSLGRAVGEAITARMLGRACRTYALVDDVSLQAGTAWEAILQAGAARLPALCAVALCATSASVPGPGDPMAWSNDAIDEMLEGFGWSVVHVDGHDLDDIRAAFAFARAESSRPTFVVARTVVSALRDAA